MHHRSLARVHVSKALNDTPLPSFDCYLISGTLITYTKITLHNIPPLYEATALWGSVNIYQAHDVFGN
jgi:hypothetical protein